MNEKLAVILVNYNGIKYNDKCITSILGNAVDTKYEVIVVDNASTDSSLDSLKEKWGNNGHVHILEAGRNVGFAKANNIGIRWAREQKFTHYFLLNNDTEIEPDVLEKLMKSYKTYRGIITPKIYFADTKIIWSAGGKFTSFFCKPVQIGLNEMDHGQYDGDRSCDFANGCALLFGNAELEQIGLLDESFFLYYEDTEFSMRAKKAGISVWYCAGAVIYHKVNGSTGGNQSPMNAYFISRNWLIFGKMHLGWKHKLFWIYFIINRFAWMMIWIMQGRIVMAKAVIKGIEDYFVWVRKKGHYDDRGPYVIG